MRFLLKQKQLVNHPGLILQTPVSTTSFYTQGVDIVREEQNLSFPKGTCFAATTKFSKVFQALQPTMEPFDLTFPYRSLFSTA